MVFVTAPHHSQIHQRSDQKPQHIDAFHRHSRVEHPRINQRGKRQENKAQHQEQKIVVIGARQVLREEEQQREHKSRRQQN